MTHDLRMDRGWAGIVASVALGAIAMYAFDPDKGRRRRALARDKAVSVLLDTRHAAGATRRDVTHRLEGLRARARRIWRRRPTTDDLQLIERVRARMGRIVTHPHAIQVGAFGGRVTLSGPVLAREVAPLLASIRTVWGVENVENLLVAHTPTPSRYQAFRAVPNQRPRMTIGRPRCARRRCRAACCSRYSACGNGRSPEA